VCGTTKLSATTLNHQPTRNDNSQERSLALKSAHEAKMGAKRVTSVCVVTICRAYTYSLSVAMHNLSGTLAGIASFYQVTKYDTAKMSSNVVPNGEFRGPIGAGNYVYEELTAYPNERSSCSTAFLRCPGDRCEYRAVIAGVLWPRSSCTVL